MRKSDSTNNIIFVTISMCGGGTERVISVLANEAVTRGMNVTIMMIGDDRVEYELDDRIDVVCVSKATGGSLSGRIKRLLSMRRLFKTNGGNVIAMGSSAGIFTLIAALGLKNKVVVSERNDPGRLNHKPISSKMKKIREFLYGTATKVVLQTEDSKSYFGKKVVNRSVIIMNPLPDEVYSRRTECIREKTIIGSGRLTVYKGYDLLINAFAKFSKNYPDYELKIFGKGELKEELQQQIDSLNINKKATLCGFSDDMYGELIKGGMYVSSSVSEGVSNALMEAVALGIPVIATDCPVGGSRMCIKDGVSGILIDVGDKDALVEAMSRIADDEALRDSLTSSAMSESEKWTVESVWNRWMELFE